MRFSSHLLIGSLLLISTAVTAWVGLQTFFPSAGHWKWIILIAGFTMSITLLAVWMFTRGSSKSKKSVIGRGILVALASLIGLGFVVATGTMVNGELYVGEVIDSKTGKRLEVYQTDQHDHVGVAIYWGTDGCPLASRSWKDHVDVTEIVQDEAGMIVLRSYFPGDSVVVDIATGAVSGTGY